METVDQEVIYEQQKKKVILLMQSHELIDYMNRKRIIGSQKIGNCSMKNNRFFLLLQLSGEKTEAKTSLEIILGSQ